jgi:hypothetical protein
MPRMFAFVELPSWAYLTETEGIEIGSFIALGRNYGFEINVGRSEIQLRNFRLAVI